MRLKEQLSVSLLLVAVATAASLWGVSVVPNLPVAVHFGADGQANGYWPKAAALAFGPIVMALMTAVFALSPRMMPAEGRLERSTVPYETAWLLVLGILLFAHLGVVLRAAGVQLDVRTLLEVVVGAGLVALGNVLPKTRFNYVIGVRTPWTLSDERVWDASHRFLAPWLMLWGVAVVLAALFTTGRTALGVMLGGTVLFTGLALTYSFLIYRKLPR